MNTTATATVHVLLTYFDGEDETFVNLFTSKQAVIDHVKDAIRQQWEEMMRFEVGDEKDDSDLEETLQDAENCLNENGWWKDVDGTVYTYDEKEYTA